MTLPTKPEVPMAAVLTLADPTNYHTRFRPSGAPTYDRIVIHCTDGRPNPDNVAEMWKEPHHGSSAHFVIGHDEPFKIVQCVPLAFAAFHAHDANSRSIGIEHCARTPGELGKTDVGLPPSDGQYRASAKLVAYLLTAAGLQPTREYVMGHHEIDPKTTHTGCPDSCGWDWSYYINLVRLEFEALVPPTAPLVA